MSHEHANPSAHAGHGSDHAHGHGHGDHSGGAGGGGGHHEPTGFFSRYVFSTDHKVIGIQFMFASLLFVILGGLLALGVRYQLAWPNQNVPFHAILPGDMAKEATELNVAHWQLGGYVELTGEAGGVPKTAHGLVESFPRGYAITVPAFTEFKEGKDGSPERAETPMQGFVSPRVVLGDYDYGRQQVRARAGTEVTIVEEDKPDRTITLVGPYQFPADGSAPGVASRDVLMPIRSEATPIDLRELSFIAATEAEIDQTKAEPEVKEAAKSELRAIQSANQVIRSKVEAIKAEGEITEEDAKAIADLESTLVPEAVTLALPDAVVPASALNYKKHTIAADGYLQLFTMHASIMIFFVIIPMLVGGFGNFVVPLMVGARDMAFPRLNMLSFWLAAPAGVLMLLSFWTAGGAAGGGWTMYPTLSGYEFSQNLGTSLWIASVGLVGFSSVVGALNYITTIINMRAPGMSMFRMPLTVWAVFITATLALFATPVLTAAMVLLLLDRTMGTTFFRPEVGGQPLMWQHLFWFYSHPAVYIMILPAMGVVSDVLSTFSRKPIFGYKPMVFAICGIAGLGFIVWGHHMFQSGMNPVLGTTFMASTIMIAVPSAIKTFNWLGTLWGGNIKFTPPMLNALAFVSMFVIGGLSGIFMASAPVDIHIHDTYFIVAHIHYVLFGGSMFGIFAGVYYWFPKMFGRNMNQRWGHIHFWMTFIGFNLTFFTMHILGVGGHPRRYASIMEYPTLQHLQPLNVLMTLGALMLGMAQIPFFFNFFVSLPRKLGRAMTALFIVALGVPAVMGLTYKAVYGNGPYAAGDGVTVDPYWQAIRWSFGAGAVYVLAVVAVVFFLWWLGGVIRLPRMIAWLLYPLFLPLFLMPLFVKPDAYYWLGIPEWAPRTWLAVLVPFAIFALPGLLYVVLRRPRDEFGEAVGDNPWQANSLEWCTSSPPPFTNFHEIPTVYRGPYEYSSPVVDEDFLPQPHRLPAGVVEPAGH